MKALVLFDRDQLRSNLEHRRDQVEELLAVFTLKLIAEMSQNPNKQGSVFTGENATASQR